ncbi:MAG: hypothetical protein QW838_02800 [Candidatus Nitrosotenuis sp.]
MALFDQWQPRGYEKIIVGATAVALSPPASADACLLIAETNPVRWRDDGTNPTSSDGFLIPKDTILSIDSRASIQASRFIQTTAGGATLHVLYYET